MIDSKNAPRYSTRIAGIKYHSKDRARKRQAKCLNDWEDFPVHESMRQAINRGPNCFGDNTSYGYYCSGQIKDQFITVLVEKHIGLTYTKLIGDISRRFSPRDKVWVNSCIDHMFHPRFGYPSDFVVIDGLIVKRA